VQVAERAFITRMDSLFAVLSVLGIEGIVVDAADPYNNRAGRSRIDDILSAGGSV